MCKIHHAAFDVHILGISPDLMVAIRRDLLEEIDGPMLEHGLKERHGQKLMVIPALRSERPDPELLASSYRSFSPLADVAHDVIAGPVAERADYVGSLEVAGDSETDCARTALQSQRCTRAI
ncbi:hypothetical protein N601_26250 [Rhodococcus erythropolis DN1]|jgi:hypothetical protein|nr:hypothetical protein [Rhodococcus erythropolis]EQM30686.1 hypothetical protein N601_26250 [Rhodococcus erythropolis DN1]